jgi:acetyl esterase/lipase
LVFLHGGGFTHGYKEWCGFMAPGLTPTVLVAVQYRLMPAVQHPEPWLDAALAVTWVHRHIGAYGGDPQRLFVGGHSAGGALAATLATRAEWLSAHGLATTDIAGIICISTTFNAFAISGSAASAYPAAGDALPSDPDAPLARSASAFGPFFIAWGGRERQRERVERSSTAMLTALRDRGLSVESRFIDEADHFDTHLALGDSSHRLTQAVRQWMGSQFAIS